MRTPGSMKVCTDRPHAWAHECASVFNKKKTTRLVCEMKPVPSPTCLFIGVETVPFVWSGTRLPQDVMPLHYDLTVQPHIYEGPDDLYHVSGSIDIHLLCHAATDIIILHAQAIKLAQVSIEGEQVYGPSVVRYGYDARNNMVAVNLSEPLVPGAQYILSIGYFKASFAETESTWVRYGYSQYVYDDEACGATVPG